MWKLPSESATDGAATPMLDSLGAVEASHATKLDIMRNLSRNPGRSVELVSKLPVGPDKKIQVLRDDVLRQLPISASKKLELLRDVPLAPSNTRVENWTNKIVQQLPLPQ